MIDYDKFKKEMNDSIEEADALDGSGPEVHSRLLEIIFQDMDDKWSRKIEALDEIDYVIEKVFHIKRKKIIIELK